MDVFYFQMAMKLDPRRIPVGIDGGKIKYLTRTQRSLTAQELVTNYENSVDFDLYKAGGQSTTTVVPNVPHITDEWIHYLYQVGPGDELAATTRIVVRRVRAGEKTYTTIFDAQSEVIDYQEIDPHAWNATILGTFHNGFNIATDFWQKYDQLIFSKQYIPPPSTFSGSVLELAAAALANGAWTADAIAFNPQSQAFDISWQNRTAFWDNENRELQYMGKAQSGGAARHFIYDEQTNTWRSPNLDVTPGKVGHIWTAAFDHTDDPGDYYHVEDGHTAAPVRTRTIRHYSRSADTWTDLPLAAFDIWSTDSPNPGAAYHPNLMGPGRPGLFAYSSVRFAWFDCVLRGSTNSLKPGHRALILVWDRPTVTETTTAVCIFPAMTSCFSAQAATSRWTVLSFRPAMGSIRARHRSSYRSQLAYRATSMLVPTC